MNAAIQARSVPTPEILLERARSLVPWLRARAAQTERERRIGAETISRLEELGLFRILQPVRFGGYEHDLGLLIDINCELGRACASTAWVYGLGVAHRYLVAMFPLEAQQEVWAAGPDCFIAGSYAPSAMAQAENGGYRISGRWSFASGVDNAQWAALGVMFPPASPDAKPRPGFLLVPAAAYTIEDDWHTVGLCGTGSKTIVIADAWVPAHRMLGFPELLGGSAPGTGIHANPLFRMPFIATNPVSILSAGLGAAQGAIDEMLNEVATRGTRGATVGAGSRIGDFPTVQMRFAEATACLDAARLLLHRDCREVLDTLRSGAQVTVATRIRNRRDHAFAAGLAVRAVDAAYAVVGGQGLYLSNATQRAWRDAHAVAKHVSFNWDAVGAMYGQHAFGLEPRGQF
jgi:alkylation response protein AidB-like acyl-CoA dehydrogenase